MNNNAENAAYNFYNWLIEMGYMVPEDRIEDIEDVKKDFIALERHAPKLFNLLRILYS